MPHRELDYKMAERNHRPLNREGLTTLVVLAISLVLALGVCAIGSVVWFGDSHTYTNFAYWLARGQFDPNLYFRTLGYPIALVLTGVVSFTSLWGIILLQAIGAALIPAAIYWTLAPLSRVSAIFGSAGVILSLVPFAFVTTIYPDQLYMTVLVCFTALLVRYATIETRPLIVYLLVASAAALWLLRPVGLVLSGLALVLLAFRRRHLYHALIGSLVVGAACGVMTDYRADRTGGSSKSMVGRQMFFNVYLNDGAIDNSATVSRIAADIDQLEQEKLDLRACGPREKPEISRLLYAPFPTSGQLATQFLRQPTLSYWWKLWCLTEMVDPGLDHVLERLALADLMANPIPWIRGVIDRYAALSLGPSWTYNINALPGMGPISTTDLPGFFAFDVQSSDPASAKNSIIPFTELDREPPRWASGLRNVTLILFAKIYQWVVRASYGLMVLGVLFLLFDGGPLRTASLTVFAVHAATVGTLAALVAPEFRYQLQTVPIAIMGASIGTAALWQAWLNRSRRVAKPP